MKHLILTLMILMIFISGCVFATGRDKNRLDEQVVWSAMIYKIYEEAAKKDENIPSDVIKKWLKTHRNNWAHFAGATEGKTSEDILKELE